MTAINKELTYELFWTIYVAFSSHFLIQMSQALRPDHVIFIGKLYLINCFEGEGIKIETVHEVKEVED